MNRIPRLSRSAFGRRLRQRIYRGLARLRLAILGVLLHRRQRLLLIFHGYFILGTRERRRWRASPAQSQTKREAAGSQTANAAAELFHVSSKIDLRNPRVHAETGGEVTLVDTETGSKPPVHWGFHAEVYVLPKTAAAIA